MRGLLLGAAFVLLSNSLQAAELSPDTEGSSKSLEGSETLQQRMPKTVPSAEPLEVSLVAIGEALPLDALVEALGSDIPDGLYLSASRGAAFNESTFLAETSGGQHRIDVWVDATDRKHVRLYFADAQTARYALRTMDVSGEMNEMDLEILAQAVLWSLRAFAEGSQETLSRSEAQSRLKPETATSAPSDWKSTSNREAVRESDTPGNAPWYSTKRSYLTDLQGFYRVGLNSPEIPAVHGPGLALGILRSKGEPIWALVASAQWQIPARYEQDGLGIELSAFAPRVHLQATFPVSKRVALGALLGGGFDAIFVKTSVLDTEAYLAREPSTQLALPFNAGALAMFKLSPRFFMSLQVGIEAYLSAPSFEFATLAGASPFVSPFPLRPTMTIGLGFL